MTDDRALRAERLKERVYITFTALAVMLALRSHGAEAVEALVTLLITVTGTLLAMFVADVVSHIAVHAVLPTGPELRGMLRVMSGAAAVIFVPLVFLLLAVAEAIRVEGALRIGTIVLVVSLIVIGNMAVRRVRLPTWQKLVVWFAEFALGILVVALELLAHG